MRVLGFYIALIVFCIFNITCDRELIDKQFMITVLLGILAILDNHNGVRS
jgi:hypothetical protein